jgi:hypothetical protein
MERRAWKYPLIAAIVLGGVGLVVGYVAPLQLDPDSNLGPLVGIIFTGPCAFVLGAVLGLVSNKLRLGLIAFSICLALAATGVTIGTVNLSRPGARWQGFVIDAEILDCRAPSVYRNEALDRMRALVRKAPTWLTRDNWEEDFDRQLGTDKGVVLTMLVHGRRDISEERDSRRPGQIAFLGAGLAAGLPLFSFLLVEWDLA